MSIFKKSCDELSSDYLEISKANLHGKEMYFIDAYEDSMWAEAGVLYTKQTMIELRDALIKEFPLYE